MGEAEREAEEGVGKCADRLSRWRNQVAALRGDNPGGTPDEVRARSRSGVTS